MTKKGQDGGGRRTVIRRTIIEEEPDTVVSQHENWFRRNPVLVAIAGVFLLIFLFAPLFTVTKTIETTETVMVPVTTQQTVPTAGTQTIKVYVGYICDVFGQQHNIDPSLGVVEFSQTRDAAGNWTLTTVDHNGNQVVYRSVTRWDLTKTGTLNVSITGRGVQTVTDTIPQHVTKQKEVKLRVNFFQWIFGSY